MNGKLSFFLQLKTLDEFFKIWAPTKVCWSFEKLQRLVDGRFLGDLSLTHGLPSRDSPSYITPLKNISFYLSNSMHFSFYFDEWQLFLLEICPDSALFLLLRCTLLVFDRRKCRGHSLARGDSRKLNCLFNSTFSKWLKSSIVWYL